MKSNVRRRYIFSFLFIAILPFIAVSFVYYFIYINYIMMQANENRLSSFESAVLQCDYTFNELLRLSDHISDSLPYYIVKSGHGYAIANEAAVFSALSSYEQNTFIRTKIFFYLRSEPYSIYTSTEKKRYTEFEAALTGKADLKISNLFYKLNTVSSSTLFRLSKSKNTNAQDGIVVFIVPIGDKSISYVGDLLFVMNESDFVNIFSHTLGEFEGSMHALSNFGETIFSYGSEGVPQMDLQTLINLTGTGIIEKKIDGTNYVFMRNNSGTGIFTYITAMKRTDFYSETGEIHSRLLLILLLLALVCCIIAFAFSQFIYQPVRNALYRITGKNKTDAKTNEFEQMINAYEKTIEDIEALESRIDSHVSIISSQFMLKLINGTLKDREKFDYYAKCISMEFKGACNAAYFLMPVDPSDKKLPYRILETCGRFHFEGADFLFSECFWENGIGLIVNFDADDPDCFIQRFGDSLLDHLKKNSVEGILLGAGSAEPNPLKISQSFYEAVASAKSMKNEDVSSVCIYQSASIKSGGFGINTALLAEGVNFGNADVALRAFGDIIKKLRTLPDPFPVIRLLCCDALNTVIRHAERQNLEMDISVLAETAEFSSLDEFEQKVGAFITDICTRTNKKRMLDDLAIRSSVINYINNNYKRNDFSLKLLSSEMNMSMSKINSMLKEDLGCSFIQYVTTLRFNEVKRLLLETDESVYNIVQSVGYIDASSFMRKFKQLEGVTPGQYRRMHETQAIKANI